jgi:hypothetical protein
VLFYRVGLDIRQELVPFVSRLSAERRREIGTAYRYRTRSPGARRAGTRAVGGTGARTGRQGRGHRPVL